MNNLNIFLLFLCLIYFKLTEDKKGDLKIIIGALSLYLLYRVLTDAEGLDSGDCVNDSTFVEGSTVQAGDAVDEGCTPVPDPATEADDPTTCTLTEAEPPALGSCTVASGSGTCTYVPSSLAVTASVVPNSCQKASGRTCGQDDAAGQSDKLTATCAECVKGGATYTGEGAGEVCPENEVCFDGGDGENKTLKCECSPSPEFCGMWQDLNTDKDSCTAYVSGVDFTCTIDNCCDTDWINVILAIIAIILLFVGLGLLYSGKKAPGGIAILLSVVLGCILGGLILFG